MKDFLKRIYSGVKGRLIVFILLLFMSSIVLVSVNYYTHKINASIRAFLFGESMYSKGQKDATRYLNQYIFYEDSVFINLYYNSISVPKGDGLAREALEANADDEIVKEYLIQGNNHQEDLSNLIWLFRNFRGLSFMKKAHEVWTTADYYIKELDLVAEEIFIKSADDSLTNDEINYNDYPH